MNMRWRRGQSTTEYVILLTVIIAGLLAMQIFLKRSLMGRARSSADSIGQQWDPFTGSWTATVKSGGSRTETLASDGKLVQDLTGQEFTTRELTDGGVGAYNEDLFETKP